jgi:hypothetical protein
MGDLGWDAILCALIPVAVIVAVVVRAVVRSQARRAEERSAQPAKDGHVQAYDLGRPPVDPTRYSRGGNGLF